MDEVKIWSVDDASNVVPLASKGQTESESLLEETLVKNPSMLIQGLRLVGRQTPTEGGPLDLLGVDSDGRLVVFELKRGTLSRDAVAQIIDYASDLDRMALDDLADYISERSGTHGIEKIDDFASWHLEHTGAESLDTLRPMRLFLIGLGADDRTERMVRFLAENSGMDISLLTFHGFAYDGKTLLARQVEVEGVTELEPRPSRRRRSAAEKWERLERRIEESGTRELFNAVKRMFQENWPQSRTRIGVWGLSFFMRRPGSRGGPSYARIWAFSGTVQVVFFPAAKALCLDAFREPVEEIRYKTWPEGREPLDDPDTEIQFELTSEEWETHKERLYALTKAMYKAWESRDREEEPS